MIRKPPDRQSESPGESQDTFRKILKANLEETRFRSAVLIECKDEVGDKEGCFFF